MARLDIYSATVKKVPRRKFATSINISCETLLLSISYIYSTSVRVNNSGVKGARRLATLHVTARKIRATPEMDTTHATAATRAMATHAISVVRTAVSVTRAASLVTFLAIATRTRALVTGSDWKEAYIVGLSAIFTDYNIADAAATSTGLVIAIRPILDLVIATPTSNATTARSLATSPPNAPKAPPTKSARTARPAIHSLY